jgi:hypothetical protein
MCENRVLGRIFGAEEGRKKQLHNEEEFHNLYSSRNIARTFKSRRMRWAGHVAQVSDVRSTCNILVGDPKFHDQQGDCHLPNKDSH